MTVGELLARISSLELTEWMAHDALTALDAEHAAKTAEMKSGLKRR